jgi:hypothetical protein
MVLLMSAMTAAARPALAEPPMPTTEARLPATATAPARREVATGEDEGLTVPDAARVALGIGAMGTIIGLVSIPNADTDLNGPATTLTLVSFGVGLTGLATAGIIIWTTPTRRVAVAAGPGAVAVHGSF